MFVETITPEEIEKMPHASFPGSIHLIDRRGREFDEAVEHLRTFDAIGFDTESRPCFTPGQKGFGVSLLQLSTGDDAFLFRVKMTGLSKGLCALLASPDTLKIGAAVHDDIAGLCKRAQFRPQGFVDLQKIVREWGIRDMSVKKMAAIILGVKISKTQQLSNWEARELSTSQKMYGATDAWVCLRMYETLLASPKNPLPPRDQ